MTDAFTITSINTPDPAGDATREPGTAWRLVLRRGDATVDLVMRWIPPTGEAGFWMGDRDGFPRDEPVHRVVLDGFWMGETPATQNQYELVTGANPSHFQGADHPESERHPVEKVEWSDCTAFAGRLTGALREGRRIQLPGAFVLPTEAEWEYACRAGTRTEYWSGDGEAALAEVGWYDKNSGERTHPVGEKNRPNPWGLHDMHGNVDEWCHDTWAENWTDENTAYREQGDGARNPLADAESSSNDGPGRVIRGGSWGDSAAWCRSAYRVGVHPGFADRLRGFRVVWVPSPSRRAQVPEGQEAEAERTERGERAELPAGAGGRWLSRRAKRVWKKFFK